MKFSAYVILTLLLMALASPAARSQDTVTVAKVLSGISFQTSTGDKITLLGISIPKSQAIDAEDVKNNLSSMLDGQTVVLVTDSMVGPDKKGQKNRFVYLNNELLNLKLVRDGYATVMNKTKHSMLSEFQSAEKDARSSQVGAYATERSYSVQCSATTKKGSQCKRMTTSLSGKCWQHE